MIPLASLVSHRWAHKLSLEITTDTPRLIQSDTRLSQISNTPINPGHLPGIFLGGGGGAFVIEGITGLPGVEPFVFL